MKSIIHSAIAAVVLVAGGSQLAHADSFALNVRDHNVGVGIHIGSPNYYPPRYVPVPVVPVVPVAPPVAYVHPSGYWGTDGYRRVWVPSPWGYAPNRWEAPVRYEYRERWDHDRHDHRRYDHHDGYRYRR